MKPTTRPLGITKKKSTKIGQPYICQRTKQCFDLSIKANLQVFQNHREKAKINIVFIIFHCWVYITMILNFSNPSTFDHETAD